MQIGIVGLGRMGSGGSDYSRKLLAMMRAGFGGHAVQKKAP